MLEVLRVEWFQVGLGLFRWLLSDIDIQVIKS